MKNNELQNYQDINQVEHRAVGRFEGRLGIACSGAGVLLLPLTVSGGALFMVSGVALMADSARRLDKAEKPVDN